MEVYLISYWWIFLLAGFILGLIGIPIDRWLDKQEDKTGFKITLLRILGVLPRAIGIILIIFGAQLWFQELGFLCL